jgi:predicted dienelactone hydrolase
MPYDPFERGRFPVGVRTIVLHETAGNRDLPVEVWYPATGAHRGQDLDEATQDVFEHTPGFPTATQPAVRDAEPDGSLDLVPLVFSHGFAGHRRQSAGYCTHLASHGYLVASPDHVGNTMLDMLPYFTPGSEDDEAVALVAGSAVNRPFDVIRTLDALYAGDAGMAAAPDRPAGMTGHSFGGWTTLQVVGWDKRFAAAVPLAPGGGDQGTFEGLDIRETLFMEWDRDVPTLILACEDDTILPVQGMRDLFERVPSPTALVILRRADHFHFCDGATEMHDFVLLMRAAADSGMKPMSQLVSEETAQRFIAGLGLAHFDAYLRDNTEPASLFDDLEAVLAAQGIDAEVRLPQTSSGV